MSDVWYTSDLHIGHKLVAGIRGFDDPDMHDADIALWWDATVRPDDQVYVLGDISINGKQPALDWISDRPGTKHLIAGNHDPVHPMHRTAQKLLPLWLEVFETVQPFARRRLNGVEFLLSHFPYASFGDGDHREGSRFDQYRLAELGMPLLHGHTHGPERAHDSMLHVGWDAWHMLVPQKEIIEWLNTRAIVAPAAA
jgi:calcineurin-like phosphoesterase family protein